MSNPTISLIRLFVTPSVYSFNACLGLSALLVISQSWTAVQTSLPYDYFFGPYGVITRSLYWFQHIPDLFSNTNLYYVFVIFGAILAGFVTYVLLQQFGRSAEQTKETLQEVAWANNSSKAKVLREVAIKTGFRLALIVVLLLAISALLRDVAPFAGNLIKAAIEDVSVYNILLGCGGFICLLAYLHICTVLIRLIALRPRIFSAVVIEP